MEIRSLLKALSSEANLQILSVLRSGSFHPRELARLLQRDESDISRRLKNLERLGLVEGRWVRVDGKNVRIYSLKVGELSITFEPGEVRVKTGGETSYKFPIRWEKRPNVDLFVGREEELKVLRNSKGVVVVYGIAGIGKTTLVARAFPEAYWYSMTGMEDFDYLAWQFGLFLNSFGWTNLIDYLRSGGREEGEILELVLEGLENTRSTVVIDDLHKCEDERVFRMLSYLAPKLEEGRVVVTTRVRPNLGIEGVVYIHLKGLEPEEAYQLVRLKGKEIPPEEFAGIYELTLGHPLAINLVIESSGLQEKGRENLFDFLFNEVYQRLGDDERRMLSLLSLFEEPLEYEAVRFLYGSKNSFPVLYSLIRRGLVERRGDYYFLHEMIKGFARQVGEIDERSAYLRYIRYLLERPAPRSFLLAFKYAVKAGARDMVRDLVLLRIRKFRRIVTDFSRAYLRLLSEVADDPHAKLEMGMVHFQNGLFEKAKKLWLEAEPELEGVFKAEVEALMADLSIELTDFESAREYLEKTRKLAEELNDTYVWLSYYIERTKYEFYQGNLEGALESAFKELELVRKLKDIEEEPLVLLHVGDIYAEMGHYLKAIRYYEEAMRLSRAYGIRSLEHTSYMELTKGYYGLGEYEKAVEYATKAAEYFLKVRNYRRAVDTMAYRCVSYIALGELDKAEADAREIIRIAQSTGYPLGWAGYLFLGAVEKLRGGDGNEYFEMGKEKLREYEWLYRAVLEGLGKVFDVSWLKKGD
ncbi:tetratricopeptide repeat protein [Thermococcus sp.]|uniref:tetratricopeptide repeat protein n=1 Tax=Thermococcus sp. TaxID=35749 RepID=UPI0025CF7FCC|nr:tetratricopeptide repeat protein [Thermococcus sp.]